MDRVERTYYPDGKIKEEIHYRDDKRHGPWLKWHPNGVLASEFWPDSTRSRNESIAYGDCINRSWHDNGKLASESQILNGKEIGRLSIYNRDGSLFVRMYFSNTGVVSRKKYDELCLKHPEWPKYADPDPKKKLPPEVRRAMAEVAQLDRASAKRRKGQFVPAYADQSEEARQRAMHDKLVNDLLASKHAEALGWLRGAPTGTARNFGEMATESCIDFVGHLYKLGAKQVLAVKIAESPDGSESTNDMLVQMPKAAKKREKLFEFESRHAQSQGFDGTPDRGQEYLYFNVKNFEV